MLFRLVSIALKKRKTLLNKDIKKLPYFIATNLHFVIIATVKVVTQRKDPKDIIHSVRNENTIMY